MRGMSNRVHRTGGRWGVRRRIAAVAVAAAAGLATGCQHKQFAERQAAIRVEKLRRTAEIWAAAEQSRPTRLDRMVQHAAWYFDNQAVEFDRNLRGAGWYLKRDVDRAGYRLPAYGEEALRILYGKPQQIERNAIILFY
jgi:hypothetical protein